MPTILFPEDGASGLLREEKGAEPADAARRTLGNVDLEAPIEQGRRIVERLLAAKPVRLERSLIPDGPGLYVISAGDAEPGQYLRAGRAAGAGGLRQRIYQNHLMGSQPGNLRSQLVHDGVCSDSDEAKRWVQRHCRVRVLVVPDEEERRWGEHFMLSVLRPKYSD